MTVTHQARTKKLLSPLLSLSKMQMSSSAKLPCYYSLQTNSFASVATVRNIIEMTSKADTKLNSMKPTSLLVCTTPMPQYRSNRICLLHHQTMEDRLALTNCWINISHCSSKISRPLTIRDFNHHCLRHPVLLRLTEEPDSRLQIKRSPSQAC